MAVKYQPKKFEEKLNKNWQKEKVYKTGDPTSPRLRGARKNYVLVMFPYPSGSGLHVGHVRIYTGTDVLARYFRMNDQSVLHPMGWDAFGLPAENAAIKAKKNPMDMVPTNIITFKRQMNMLGLSYDWDKELATTDPNYYKWTQWLFIQFFKMGLLYKKNTPINFCPKCKTGLAEEEVLSNGTHERCGTKIEKKELPQWIFRITTYAERLLNDLEGLDWPKGILDMQKNWIGKKEGTEIEFRILNSKFKIKVFTTRVDTIYGVTAIVVSPEHSLAKEAAKKSKEVLNYVEESQIKSDLQREDIAREKTGVKTDFMAIHPLTGNELPVYVGDYVLGSYGTGAVMVVPAHDGRDFLFAKKYDLKIKTVITKQDTKDSKPEKIFTDYGILVNSEGFNDLTSKEAIVKITEYLKKKNLGTQKTSYHLRDWIFSRQRYWGEPIPMVFCESCAKKRISWWTTDEGKTFKKSYQTIIKLDQNIQNDLVGWFPLFEQNLPLELPYLKSYEPTDTGESPLAKIKTWTKTTCPHCGSLAQRETDTMPNWAGSCWYFLRFASQKINHKSQIINYKKNSNIKSQNMFGTWNLEFGTYVKEWLPVDWYLGGAEHAVLHLLYARFWTKALKDLGLLNFSEPFLKLRNVGMVLAEDHRKMSKSFGNTINPDDVVAEYGADTLRVYEMFMAPFNAEIAWSISSLQGAYRFLNRIWEIYRKVYQKQNGRTSEVKEERSDGETSEVNEMARKKLIIKLNKTIEKVTNDIQETKFNTAIASMMEFLNDFERTPELAPYDAKKFLQILAPFAPFMTEEIWKNVFGEKKSIHLSSWPQAEKVAIEDEIKIPVQVNGKVRSVIMIRRDATEEITVNTAINDVRVSKFLIGKQYKPIYIKNKILNLVIL